MFAVVSVLVWFYFVSSFSSCGHPEMTGMYRNTPIPRRIKFKNNFITELQGEKKNTRLVIFPNSSCHEIENAFWFIEQIGGSEFQKFRFPHKGSIMAKQVLCWEFWPGATLLINTSVEFSWI